MEKFDDIWPTTAALAKDLGLPYPTVNSWKQRNIPARRFRQIMDAAAARGAVLTFADLERVNADIAARLADGQDAAPLGSIDERCACRGDAPDQSRRLA